MLCTLLSMYNNIRLCVHFGQYKMYCNIISSKHTLSFYGAHTHTHNRRTLNRFIACRIRLWKISHVYFILCLCPTFFGLIFIFDYILVSKLLMKTTDKRWIKIQWKKTMFSKEHEQHNVHTVLLFWDWKRSERSSERVSLGISVNWTQVNCRNSKLILVCRLHFAQMNFEDIRS